VPLPAAGQLGVLPAAVRLPAGDLVPDVRRPVTNPKEFAADGLGAAGAAGARPALPPGPTGDPRDARAVVDVAAVLVAGGRPRYPEVLLASRVEGEVVVRFVVDTAGRVDARTFTVVRSSHALFERAVRQSLARIRYRPAEAGGRAVRQTVEQTFKFAPGG
jgi:TonB family protein